MNRGEENEENITVEVKPQDLILSFPFWMIVYEKFKSLAQVEGLAKEKVMVYEADANFSIGKLLNSYS